MRTHLLSVTLSLPFCQKERLTSTQLVKTVNRERERERENVLKFTKHYTVVNPIVCFSSILLLCNFFFFFFDI